MSTIPNWPIRETHSHKTFNLKIALVRFCSSRQPIIDLTISVFLQRDRPAVVKNGRSGEETDMIGKVTQKSRSDAGESPRMRKESDVKELITTVTQLRARKDVLINRRGLIFVYS